MRFNKKTIRDIDVSGKKILLRVDYSVDVGGDGEIGNDYKIRASLPTIRYLLERGAAVAICSHMGRPEGKVVNSLSLFSVAKHLNKLLENTKVDFVPECVGERVQKAKDGLRPGQVILLENLRFDAREESNDQGFAAELASGMDIFVQDGFAVAYRQHASVDAITKQLPSVAGLLLEKEILSLGYVFGGTAKKPVVAIINGLSVNERLHVIESAIERADVIAFGGLLADVFIHEIGVHTGKTSIDKSELPLARELLVRMRKAHEERGLQLYLPQDAVAAKRTDVLAETRIVDWSAHVIADIEAYPKRAPHESGQVKDDEIIVDIGPFTGAYLAGVMQFAGTVLLAGTPGDTTVVGHRGPVGPFAHGTELIVEGMTGQFGRKPDVTVVAGDDAVNYVINRGLESGITHVSTGGGASMEVLAGRSLIGVDVLEELE